MNMLERMNLAIDYVESHITEALDIPMLARLAESSTYNFQRMFSCIAEVSIVEYVRRRRLTLAALELQQGGRKVIDVALKYGYDSPVSFARAFAAMHGATPSEAKKHNISLKAFPRMTFQFTIKGVSEMNYRIVRTRPLKVFGIEGIISTAGDEGCFSHAGAIWQKFQGNGEYDRLEQAAGKQRPAQYGDMFVKDMCTVHGLLNNKQIGDTKFGYLLCALVAPDSRTDGYTAFEVPETTWAVFPMDIPDWDIGAAIERVNRQFYSEWLPTSEYEKADAPEFEMYGGEPGEMGYIEFWMPVVKKK